MYAISNGAIDPYFSILSITLENDFNRACIFRYPLI